MEANEGNKGGSDCALMANCKCVPSKHTRANGASSGEGLREPQIDTDEHREGRGRNQRN